MKKLIALFLSVILLTCLFACGGSEDKPAGTDTETTVAGSVKDTEKAADTGKKETTEPIVVTEPELTTLPETEPAPLTVPESGYCAVGQYDEASKKAAVLFGNGLMQVMNVVGDVAPVAGTVMAFETEGENIAFAEITLDAGLPSWRLFNYPGSADIFYNTDGATEWRFPLAEAAVGFVKLSDTQWTAYSGSGFLEIAGSLPTQFADTVWCCNLNGIIESDTITLVFVDGTTECAHADYDTDMVDPLCLFTADGMPVSPEDENVINVVIG